MLMRAEQLRNAVLLGLASLAFANSLPCPAWATPTSTQQSVASETMAQRAAREQAEDDEEDAFFSSGSKPSATGTVATANPVAPAMRAAPAVDVVATCQAVLADNLNYYNYNFIEGCKKAVASIGQRRILR